MLHVGFHLPRWLLFIPIPLKNVSLALPPPSPPPIIMLLSENLWNVPNMILPTGDLLHHFPKQEWPDQIMLLTLPLKRPSNKWSRISQTLWQTSAHNMHQEMSIVRWIFCFTRYVPELQAFISVHNCCFMKDKYDWSYRIRIMWLHYRSAETVWQDVLTAKEDRFSQHVEHPRNT